jgi:neutral ceramidase
MQAAVCSLQRLPGNSDWHSATRRAVWRHTMKQRWRIAGRITAGLLIAVGLLAAGTLTTVDRRPFDEVPALRSAITPAGSTAIASIATGPLRAGFGRARLTPTVGASVDRPEAGEFRSLPLAGYGARQGRPAAGVQDELWAKAIAFAVGGQTGIVVSADALIIPREVTALAIRRLEAGRHLRREQVFFSATHTHGGPGGWGEGPVGEAFAGPFQPAIREWLAQQLAQAVETALDDLSPAALGTGSFAAPDFIRNRLRGGDGTVDAEFALVFVRQDDGDSAVLGSYGAHATVIGAEVMDFHGDYPAAWQGALETTSVGLAVFAAGGMGSHSPRAPAGGLDGATQMGRALAAQTRHQLALIAVTNEVRFGVAGMTLPLPALQVRLTAGMRLRPWVARTFLPVGEEVLLQGFRFNDALWLSTPCDFSGELARELKEEFRERGMAVNVTSFNGDYVGYVVPARYYELPGYEPRTMSFYGPQLPDYFMAALRSLGEDLSPGRQPR